MSKIKRCPFCDAEMESSNNQYYFHPDNDCILHGFGFADRRSIKAWNTRKPMQNIVERLREKAKEPMYQHHGDNYYVGIYNAIEIVKEEGGMNE